MPLPILGKNISRHQRSLLKRFRSIGAVFNNSAIILKLTWPEKNELVVFRKVLYFQKSNIISPNNVGVVILMRPKRQEKWGNSASRLTFIDGRLKIKMVFFSKHAFLHETEWIMLNMLRHEEWRYIIIKCICAVNWNKVQRPKKDKLWLRWQVRSQTCEIVCNTVTTCVNSVLSTVAFLVTILDYLPKLAFVLHVRYERTNWVILSPPLFEKYKT